MPFARRATAALMPTLPTFADVSLGLGAGPRAERDAADVDRSACSPSSAVRTASSNRVGIRCVRTKSMPVPIGIDRELGARRRRA